MFDIGRPDLDWVHLAKGMGVPGTRVTSLSEFVTGIVIPIDGGFSAYTGV